MNDSHYEPAPGNPLPEDERFDLIIAAALMAFGENGYGSTRLADIAVRAGVSTSTLLRYFPSKDEIFREVVRSTFIGSLTVRDEAAGPAKEPSATEEVRAVARRYWTAMERPELATVVRLVLCEIPRFPELAFFHAETLERFARVLERTIQRGIDRGELRPVETRTAARTIVAGVAMHALWLAHPEIYGCLTGTDHDRVVDTTIETLVQALGPLAVTTPVKDTMVTDQPPNHDTVAIAP